jgi:hypothetical protein
MSLTGSEGDRRAIPHYSGAPVCPSRKRPGLVRLSVPYPPDTRNTHIQNTAQNPPSEKFPGNFCSLVSSDQDVRNCLADAATLHIFTHGNQCISVNFLMMTRLLHRYGLNNQDFYETSCASLIG